MTRYQWRHHLSGLIGMSHTEVLPMEEKGNKGNTCNTTLGVSVRWTPRRWVGRWSCGVLIPPTMLTTCRGRLNCLCNYYYGTTTTTATELITAVCKHYHWCACVQCANVEAAAACVTTTTSEPSMKIPLPKPTSAQCATSTIHCALCICKRRSCRQGGVKNPKVGKVKTGKQIIYHVTAPMSEQFLKSRSDRLSLAKLP